MPSLREIHLLAADSGSVLPGGRYSRRSRPQSARLARYLEASWRLVHQASPGKTQSPRASLQDYEQLPNLERATMGSARPGGAICTACVHRRANRSHDGDPLTGGPGSHKYSPRARVDDNRLTETGISPDSGGQGSVDFLRELARGRPPAIQERHQGCTRGRLCSRLRVIRGPWAVRGS